AGCMPGALSNAAPPRHDVKSTPITVRRARCQSAPQVILARGAGRLSFSRRRLTPATLRVDAVVCSRGLTPAARLSFSRRRLTPATLPTLSWSLPAGLRLGGCGLFDDV